MDATDDMLAEDPTPLDLPHKYHQHDADLTTDHGDPDELLDPDAAAALAVSPEDYVLSSDEAMTAALDQAEGR